MLRADGTVRKTRRAINQVGHLHELTFSCYQRIPFLTKDRTRHWFLDALDRARATHPIAIVAYVIMPEHAHVLIDPLQDQHDISKVLQTVKQSVSRRATIYLRSSAPHWLDRIKVTWPDGRAEHRFWQQGGGYDRNIFARNSVGASIDYLHNNPVRRGLATTPTDWR